MSAGKRWRRLLWKEWRETRLLVLAYVGVCLAPLAGIGLGIWKYDLAQLAAHIYLHGMIVVAAFLGGRAWAEDIERGTIDWFTALPGGRDALWLGKLALLAAEVVLLGLLAGGACLYLGYQFLNWSVLAALNISHLSLFAVPGAGLATLLISFSLSVYCRKTFLAAAGGAILFYLNYTLLLVVLFVPLGAPGPGGLLEPELIGVFGWFFLAAGLVLLLFFRRELRPWPRGGRPALRALAAGLAAFLLAYLLVGGAVFAGWRRASVAELADIRLAWCSPDGRYLLFNTRTRGPLIYRDDSGVMVHGSSIVDDRAWLLEDGRVRELLGPFADALPGTFVPGESGRPACFLAAEYDWPRSVTRVWTDFRLRISLDGEGYYVPYYSRAAAVSDRVRDTVCRAADGRELWRLAEPPDAPAMDEHRALRQQAVSCRWSKRLDGFLEWTYEYRSRELTARLLDRNGNERTRREFRFDEQVRWEQWSEAPAVNFRDRGEGGVVVVDEAGRFRLEPVAGFVLSAAQTADGRRLFLLAAREEGPGPTPDKKIFRGRTLCRDLLTGEEEQLGECRYLGGDKGFGFMVVNEDGNAALIDWRVEMLEPAPPRVVLWRRGRDRVGLEWGRDCYFSPGGDRLLAVNWEDGYSLQDITGEEPREIAAGRLPGFRQGRSLYWATDDVLYFVGERKRVINRLVFSTGVVEQVFP